MARLRVLGLLLFAAASAQAVAAPAEAAANKARGEFFAREHCGICHAVGRTGASPYPRAPAFRTLPQKYDVEGLAEALAEGIVVSDTGERQMPEFTLSPEEIDDLIAYLKSLAPNATALPTARELPPRPVHVR